MKKIIIIILSSMCLLECKIYYSQEEVNQDRYLNEKIFKGMQGGFFVDIGAHDGITHSNTYFFEKELKWQGICFEPLPQVFEKLRQNRKCICINGCVAEKYGEVDFIEASGYTEMLSGMVKTYDPRHLERLEREIKKFGGSYKIIKVHTYNFNEVMAEYGIQNIDYLSIDTEGSELLILESIDYDSISIHYITVENNYANPSIKKFLISKGFNYIKSLAQDELFENQNYKRNNNNNNK